MTEFGDTLWRQAGLWALDSSSANLWASVERCVLPKSRADFLTVQETKRVGYAGAAGVVRAARAAGWNCSASPALRGETDLGSGGCAVAARRGIGVREPGDIAISSALAHRFHLAKVSALTKGGFYLATLYLQDAVGLNDFNVRLL